MTSLQMDGPAVSTGRTRPRTHRALAGVFFALSAVGLIGTWAYNIAFITSGSDIGYVQAWFANAASSSAAVDLLVMATAASIVMVVESRRLGWSRRAWILIPLSFLIAVAFTFPLFLGLRELHLARRAAALNGA